MEKEEKVVIYNTYVSIYIYSIYKHIQNLIYSMCDIVKSTCYKSSNFKDTTNDVYEFKAQL